MYVYLYKWKWNKWKIPSTLTLGVALNQGSPSLSASL